MDEELISILACPQCKGKLVYDEQTSELICRFEKLAYPIYEGRIPVLLPTQARHIT